MRNYLFGLILLAYVTTLSASQDSDFIAARQAFQNGNAKLLDDYAKRLKHHALWPYVEYFQLRMVLGTTNIETIANFLSRREGTLVADRLRSDWLKMLGKNKQWQLFEAEYPFLVNNVFMECDDGFLRMYGGYRYREVRQVLNEDALYIRSTCDYLSESFLSILRIEVEAYVFWENSDIFDADDMN